MADRAAKSSRQSTASSPNCSSPAAMPAIHRHMRSHGEIRRIWFCKDWRSSRRSRVRQQCIGRTRNLITDIADLSRTRSDENVRSGVTTLLCGAAWSAGVDVRGRRTWRARTDALSPENLVGRATQWFSPEARSLGWPRRTESPRRCPPTGWFAVAARVTADSHRAIGRVARSRNGGDKNWASRRLTATLGFAALNAAEQRFYLGFRGCGMRRHGGLIKGGIGSASLDLGEGLVVARWALSSSAGPGCPDGKTYWAWPSSWPKNSAAADRPSRSGT